MCWLDVFWLVMLVTGFTWFQLVSTGFSVWFCNSDLSIWCQIYMWRVCDCPVHWGTLWLLISNFKCHIQVLRRMIWQINVVLLAWTWKTIWRRHCFCLCVRLLQLIVVDLSGFQLSLYFSGVGIPNLEGTWFDMTWLDLWRWCLDLQKLFAWGKTFAQWWLNFEFGMTPLCLHLDDWLVFFLSLSLSVLFVSPFFCLFLSFPCLCLSLSVFICFVLSFFVLICKLWYA